MKKSYAEGELVIFIIGEYSDTSYIGPFKVIKDFICAEVAQQFRDEWKQESDPDNDGDYPEPGSFIAWMAKNGYIEDHEAERWYIGSYGEFTG